ncbi:MAG: MauE/DoxX family redox-associated membrane protein, partial [Chloroflexota bacterium]
GTTCRQCQPLIETLKVVTMVFVAFALQLYFAATLGVSGLAKLDQQAGFANNLGRYRLFPGWSIRPLALGVPLVEIALAGFLLSGLAAMSAGLVTIVLLSIFLAVRIVLLATKRVTDCGCHGGLLAERLDGASIITSFILVTLACVQVYAIWRGGDAIPVVWRAPFIVGYGTAAAWLLYRMSGRSRASRSQLLAPRQGVSTLATPR